MMERIKKTIFALLTDLIPINLKRALFNSWQDDDEFWFHCRIVSGEGGELYKNRFLPRDLNGPIDAINDRFGVDKKIYVVTDTKVDLPARFEVIELTALSKIHEEISVFILAFNSDQQLLKAVQAIKMRSNWFYYCPARYLPTSRYFHRNDIAKEILIKERALYLGKFDYADFENIIQALDVTRNVVGDYVEIGVYKGDSGHLALEYMRRAAIQRKSYFFDLFEGFTNEPSGESNDAVWVNTHADTSLQHVSRLLADFENVVIQKLDIIADDLPKDIAQIALCNIDVDMYEAVKCALSKVAPLIPVGGIIILEDQGHTPLLAGAFVASQEFIQSNNKDFVSIHLTSGQMMLVRIARTQTK